jgi:hypothetical protein
VDDDRRAPDVATYGSRKPQFPDVFRGPGHGAFEPPIVFLVAPVAAYFLACVYAAGVPSKGYSRFRDGISAWLPEFTGQDDREFREVGKGG